MSTGDAEVHSTPVEKDNDDGIRVVAPLYVNRIASLPVSARDSSPNIRLRQLFDCDRSIPSERWKRVLIGGFLIDLPWLLLHEAPALLSVQSELVLLVGNPSADVSMDFTAWRNVSSSNSENEKEGESESILLHRKQVLLSMLARSDIEDEEEEGPRLRIARAPLPLSFGVHHSKFALCENQRGLRVIITTSNFLYCDWNNKAQLVYAQDFLRKTSSSSSSSCGSAGRAFQDSLAAYLHHANNSTAAGATPLFPPNVSAFLSQFDFSSVAVDLVSSVPGFHLRQTAECSRCSGMWQLEYHTARMNDAAAVPEKSAPRLVWQYTSQGSLTESFLHDLQQAMLFMDERGRNSKGATKRKAGEGGSTSGGKRKRDATDNREEDGGDDSKAAALAPIVQVVYPTEQEVRESLEGWRAGFSIPVRMANFHPFINARLHRWTPCENGETSAAQIDSHPRWFVLPHMKCYSRVLPPASGSAARLRWFLMSSANLSRAAWGEQQKSGQQLAIRSYEMGVLFTPERACEAVARMRSSGCAVTPSSARDCFFRFSVTPSCPLPRPEPIRGDGLHTVQLSMSNSSSAGGEGESVGGDAVHLLMYLPINPTNAAPYRSGGGGSGVSGELDVPWALDAPHVGRDALGLSIEQAMEVAEHATTGPTACSAPVRRWR